MEISETLLLAFLSIKLNKLRAGLTILGIVIGVTTIITILSLIQGLNVTIAKQVAEVGSGIITVSKFSYVQLGNIDIEEIKKRKDFTLADAKAIGRLENVDMVCPFITFATGKIVECGGKKIKQVTIIGTTPAYFDIRGNYHIEDGRALISTDLTHTQSVCCIGDYIFQELFAGIDPIGKYVKIEGYKFKVIGRLGKLGTFLGQNLDNVAILPLATVTKLFKPEVEYAADFFNTLQIDVKAKESKNTEKLVDEIRNLLRRRRGIPFEKPDDFCINTPEMLMNLYKEITKVAFIVMIGISAISLVVSGIGIMNIMLVSVTERTKEIGIRMAIGARRQDILTQFLIEAVVLSLFGGVIGIILGFAIASFVAVVSPLPFAISWWTVILGLTFSAAVGIFFGIYPAQKASRLNPVEALRFE